MRNSKKERSTNSGTISLKNLSSCSNPSISHPSHYNQGKIEVIEFIEDKNLGFHLGNTVKYVCRAGLKDPTKHIEDLEKAEWYLRRKIEMLKAEKEERATTRPNAMSRMPKVRRPGVS